MTFNHSLQFRSLSLGGWANLSLEFEISEFFEHLHCVTLGSFLKGIFRVDFRLWLGFDFSAFFYRAVTYYRIINFNSNLKTIYANGNCLMNKQKKKKPKTAWLCTEKKLCDANINRKQKARAVKPQIWLIHFSL